MGAVFNFQLGNVKLLVTIGTAKFLDVLINRAADRMHWMSGPIVFGAECIIPIVLKSFVRKPFDLRAELSFVKQAFAFLIAHPSPNHLNNAHNLFSVLHRDLRHALQCRVLVGYPAPFSLLQRP